MNARSGVSFFSVLFSIVFAILIIPNLAEAQSGVQWRDIQRLLRQNGFTGVPENNDQSDWASNRALIVLCRNIDCAKYEKQGKTDLDAWAEALDEGLRSRAASNYYSVEATTARPVPTKAQFIDSGRKIVSFDGDDLSIWSAENFSRLSFHRIGLSSELESDYELKVSKDQNYTAAINKYWITIVDNRSGAIAGWLPLTALDGVKFDSIQRLDRPTAAFLPATSKLVVARGDGTIAVFDWSTRDISILRGKLPKGGEPSITSTPGANGFVVTFKYQSDLFIVRNVSDQIRGAKVQAPPSKSYELKAINDEQALFAMYGSSSTGFIVELAGGRVQSFKANSLCDYAGAAAFRETAISEYSLSLESGSLNLSETKLGCDSKASSFGTELCRHIACQEYANNIDQSSDGSSALIPLRAGFALLRRERLAGGDNWKATLPPTLGSHGIGSDANGAPFAFSESGKVFDARANSSEVRVRANLDSSSVVRVVNAPSASDWISLSKSGVLSVAQAGRAVRRIALSSEREPDNAQLFVANNGRTAVAVLPSSKNPTSRDWGGSDIAIVDIDTLTVRKTFRVNPVNAPKSTPQIWVLSQTTATMLNDGRHLAISIYEPVIQIFDIQTGVRVRAISTSAGNLRANNDKSSNFAKVLRTINEPIQRLHSSPAALSPRGQQGLLITLGITGFIDTNMVASIDDALSGSVIVASTFQRLSKLIEATTPDEYVVLLSSGLLAKVDSSGNIRTSYDHQGIANVARLGADGLIYAITSAGIVRIYKDSGSLLGELAFYHDGEWVLKTPEGFFDASKGGGARVTVRTGPMQAMPIDSFYDSLYRPDLVREKLAGDPAGKVKAAAMQLDLAKVMASGKAPRVTISSPLSGFSSPVDEIELEVQVVDQGGGLGKIEWRVNGVTLGVETRGFERVDRTQTAIEQLVKKKLALERGDNRIEIVAYNARNLISSEPSRVTVKWDGERTATPPKLYVLAVGINDYYDSRLKLAYAVPDAVALADGLTKAGRGFYADVEVTKVLDAEVTIPNLEKAFNDLSAKVQPRDVFVFFLAGHGKTKNGRYYYLPRDFRYEDDASIEKSGLNQDRFQAWLSVIPARKSILLYDTCESGSLTGNAARGSDLDERLGALNRMARATGRTFLTATTDDAPALEGYRGHGVFTYALLEAIERGDTNGNGLIEVSELADYIDSKVPDYSFEAFKLRQIPQRSIVGNNFTVSNRASVIGSIPDSIPTKATHVVIAPAVVKAAAGEASAALAQLPPGTQVRLIEATGSWVLVARDGQKIGYVLGNSLLQLQ